MGLQNWLCYYEKITYSEEKIKWRCFVWSLIPLIFTAGYINSALQYPNLITWALILLFLFIIFHGDALLHLVFSQAPTVPSIINVVYVKPKSMFYKVSSYVWIIFLIWKIAVNRAEIYEFIKTFYLLSPVEKSINLSLLGKNDGSGMIVLITPILFSFVLEKYLVGVSNKKLEYFCKLGTATGRILYPILILIFISALFIIPPIVYFYSVVPIVGKITPSIFTFDGFMDLVWTLSISGILVIAIFLIVIVLEALVELVETRDKIRNIWR